MIGIDSLISWFGHHAVEPISLFEILIHCLPDCSFLSLNEAVNTHALVFRAH